MASLPPGYRVSVRRVSPREVEMTVRPRRVTRVALAAFCVALQGVSGTAAVVERLIGLPISFEVKVG